MSNVHTGNIERTSHMMYPRVEWSACCSDMHAALREGTDNEGYGPLVYVERGMIKMGSGLDPISECPWCGLQLSIHPSAFTYLDNYIKSEQQNVEGKT